MFCETRNGIFTYIFDNPPLSADKTINCGPPTIALMDLEIRSLLVPVRSGYWSDVWYNVNC